MSRAGLQRRALLAAGAAALLGAAAHAGVQKERAEVPEAAPLVIGGVRYEAPPWTRTRGLPQNGGYVAAYDVASGRELWIRKVYAASGPADIESDKRDVFIVELHPDADGRRIVVTDERGRRWRLDPASGKVAKLAGAPKR